MLRKILAAVLALSMLLSLVSCGTSSQSPAPAETPAASAEPAESAAPAESSDPAEPAASEEPAVSEEPAEIELPAETEAPAEPETPAAAEVPTETAAPEEANQEPLSVGVKILSDEEYRDQATEDTNVLGDPCQDYCAIVQLELNQEVASVALYSLEADVNDDGKLKVELGEQQGETTGRIYADALTVICGDLGETLPILGFSVTKLNGEVHYYYLGMSGMDGSALITEFTPGEYEQ